MKKEKKKGKVAEKRPPEKKEKKNNGFSKDKWTFGIVALVALVLLGYWAFWSVSTTNKLQYWQDKARQESAIATQYKTRLEKIKPAIVGKGEGIEHALIRQLIAGPQTYGFKGDAGDKKAVKAWAQKRAHQIAILAGYVNIKTGEEVWVRGKGGEVAYLLTVDSEGKVSVEEYTVGDGNFKAAPEQTNRLADDYGKAQFQGSSPGGLQSYEYLYVPHKVG